MTEKKSVAISVAIIGAIATVVAALITARSCGGESQDIPYAGRVTDKQTLQIIKGATVYVDTRGQTQRYYTGDSGTFRVLLPQPVTSVHIRVEYDGYKVFDDYVAPASKNELEDIRLERLDDPALNIMTLPQTSLEDIITALGRMSGATIEFNKDCPKAVRETIVPVPEGKLSGDSVVTVLNLAKAKANARSRVEFEVETIKDKVSYRINCRP